MRAICWCTVVSLLLFGCEEKAPPRISGTPLVKDVAHDVFLSPNGQYVATLTDPQPSKELGAPQDILLGSLTLVPVSGGKALRIGSDVPNLPAKVLYSKDGAWIACVSEFSVTHNIGELRVANVATGKVETLASSVTYFRFSPRGDTLAYVNAGDLFLKQNASSAPLQIASNVALMEFSATGDRILVKHAARLGGNLGVYDVAAGKLTEVARGVGTFGFSPTGDTFVFRADGLLVPGIIESGGKVVRATNDAAGFYRVLGNTPPRLLATERISDFKFAPQGGRLAWVTPAFGSAPVGDLFMAEGNEVKRVAVRVMQFDFTPDGTLYLLGVYDSREQAGTLGYVPPNGALVELARDVKRFTITPQGRYVLYSRGVATPNSFTLALEVQRVGASADEKPRRVDTGVFGYVVDAQEQRLAYKARCMEGGQACSLFVTSLGQTTPSVMLAQRVSAFDFAPAPHGLVIVTSQHQGELTGILRYSLGVVAAEPNAVVQVLDDQMDGDFTLAGPDHDKAVYVVHEKGREGLYVSALTSLPAPAKTVQQ